MGSTTDPYVVIHGVRTSDSTNKTISFKLDLHLTHKRSGKSEAGSKLGYHETPPDVDAPLASARKQCHIDQMDV